MNARTVEPYPRAETVSAHLPDAAWPLSSARYRAAAALVDRYLAVWPGASLLACAPPQPLAVAVAAQLRAAGLRVVLITDAAPLPKRLSAMDQLAAGQVNAVITDGPALDELAHFMPEFLIDFGPQGPVLHRRKLRIIHTAGGAA